MSNISTRLDSLNHQLMVISKLQQMDEDYKTYSTSICKKCSIYNCNKVCHCTHHILSLKEQCNRLNCSNKCISHSDSKKKVPCTSRICKAHRKLILCKNTKLTEDLKGDEQVSKSINIDTNSNESTQNKSDQIDCNSHPFKTYFANKTVYTYEEKSEQTTPTKDNAYIESNINNLSANTVHMMVPKKENAQIEIDKNDIQENNELAGIHHSTEDIPVKDDKMIERIQKDLLNERKHTKELEKKVKSLICSLKCLKEESGQKTTCLKDTIETVEKQTETSLANGNREEELLNQITKLQQQIIEVANINTTLSQECDYLKNKLQFSSEEEAKQYEEVEKEVNRMRNAVKEKEDVLSIERAEFMDMIMELTNVIKIQKRRICEITGICNHQQHTLQEKDKELHEKNNVLSEVKNMLESRNCTCIELEEKIEQLKYCLDEENKTCNCLKQELETLTEDHSSELRIKEKIIEEQNKTISKQKKLLHDSEEMARQLACEFDQLKHELYKEKQKNKSLQITLEKADTELNNVYVSQCEQCRTLTSEINYLKKEKQRALEVAKFAYQKLHQSIKQYQTKLLYERQQHRYMVSIVRKKEQEIGCLKNQVHQYNARSIKEMNSCVI